MTADIADEIEHLRAVLDHERAVDTHLEEPPASATATAAQNDDALIEKYAAAMYEAYFEAVRKSSWYVYSYEMEAHFVKWADAADSERDFAKTMARATLNILGLLSPKGTV